MVSLSPIGAFMQRPRLSSAPDLAISKGIYLSAALLFITKLFDLYRLNWWPRSLGGLTCYVFFWATSLAVGFGCHWADIFGIGRRRARWDEGGAGGSGEDDEVDWERKSE